MSYFVFAAAFVLVDASRLLHVLVIALSLVHAFHFPVVRLKPSAGLFVLHKIFPELVVAVQTIYMFFYNPAM
jgi:hypothetical protein